MLPRHCHAIPRYFVMKYWLFRFLAALFAVVFVALFVTPGFEVDSARSGAPTTQLASLGGLGNFDLLASSAIRPDAFRALFSDTHRLQLETRFGVPTMLWPLDQERGTAQYTSRGEALPA